MVKTWDTAADFDNEQTSSGYAHENESSTPNDDDGAFRRAYSYTGPPLTGGLVAWYPLTDETGQDYNFNQLHGTHSGVDSGVLGRAGLQSTHYDNGAYTQLPDSSLINIGSNFSLGAWVRFSTSPSSGEFDYIYAERSAGTGGNVVEFGRTDSGLLTVGTYDGSWNRAQSTTTVQLHEWYHVVGTGDGSTLRLYVNGAEEGTNAYATPNSSDSARIGWNFFDSQGAEAYICDFRMYDRALSQSEVQRLHSWGSVDVAQDPTDGVSRYALDGDVTDSWGSNGGTNNGVSFVNDAIRGQAGDFESSNNDYISIPDDTSISGPSRISLSAWFNLDTTGVRQYFIAKGSDVGGTDTWEYLMNVEPNNTVRFGIRDTSSTNLLSEGSTTVTSGSWYHVAGVYDGQDVVVYLNGQEQNRISASGNDILDDSGDVAIGRENEPAAYIGGKIDDVRIYDRALSSREVFELYRWGTRGRDMRKDLVTI